MAPPSSPLAWKIPWMEEPGGLQSMGSQRVGDDWATSLSRIGEGNGNRLQCSCLENPRDRGAWWAAVYGVTQSRTRLKWFSSSSSSSSVLPVGKWEANPSSLLHPALHPCISDTPYCNSWLLSSQLVLNLYVCICVFRLARVINKYEIKTICTESCGNQWWIVIPYEWMSVKETWAQQWGDGLWSQNACVHPLPAPDAHCRPPRPTSRLPHAHPPPPMPIAVPPHAHRCPPTPTASMFWGAYVTSTVSPSAKWLPCMVVRIKLINTCKKLRVAFITLWTW